MIQLMTAWAVWFGMMTLMLPKTKEYKTATRVNGRDGDHQWSDAG